jgi:hypothetical protein
MSLTLLAHAALFFVGVLPVPESEGCGFRLAPVGERDGADDQRAVLGGRVEVEACVRDVQVVSADDEDPAAVCCYVEPFGVIGVLGVELFTVEDFASDAELEEAVRGGGELTVGWGLPGLLQDGGVVGTHGQLEAMREQERDQSGDRFAPVFPLTTWSKV